MSTGGVKHCGPCRQTGLVKDMDTLCQQCDEYMCTDCFASHKIFKIARNHTVTVVSGSGGDAKLSLTYCEEHLEKDIVWFCKKHGLMFCETCKHIYHKKCQVTSISDAADEHGQRLTDVEGSMTELKERISNLKNEREKSIEVENMIIVDAYKGLITKLETELRTAGEAKATADGVTCVIAAHKMCKTLKSLELTVSDLEQGIYSENIKFQPSRTLADLRTCVDRLGKVDIDRTKADGVAPPGSASGPVSPPSTRMSFTDMKVESPTDINVPEGGITGAAVLPDGRIILVGYTEWQVILLDRNLTVQTSLKLEDQPWDVAADGDNGAIMAMYSIKKLQWIHVDGAPRAGHTINTSLACRGVAVHGGHIYVTVKSSEIGGNVQILDRSGTVIRCIVLDARGTGTFTNPNNIAVGARGQVFVTDYIDSRIACFTNGGNLVYSVDLEETRGLAVDGDDNVIVCCYCSHEVHVLWKDGSRYRVVLSPADGVRRPLSVTYRDSDNTLIVTMNETPYCRAYKLK